MRRIVVFLLLVLGLVGTSTRAAAKSNEIGMIVPGARWTTESAIGMGSSEAASEALATPYFAYVEARATKKMEPLRVALVELSRLARDDRVLRYRVSFVVPHLETGRYRVVMCDLGCERLLGGTWLGSRLHVVESSRERRLRELIAVQRLEMSDRIALLHDELAAEIGMRDIRQRYQATRLLELGRRIERLEGRPIPTTSRGAVPALWLIGLGLSGGIAASALAARMRRRSLKWSAQRSIT